MSIHRDASPRFYRGFEPRTKHGSDAREWSAVTIGGVSRCAEIARINMRPAPEAARHDLPRR
jgi:hypothetical protein